MRTPPPYITIQKPISITPLEAIQSWKALHPEYADLPATYAGRLDPMASGTLLALLGEECKKKERYLGLDKEYEIEIVLGIGTDTGDALGLPVPAAQGSGASVTPAALQQALRACTGSHTVPYPAFSSKTVNGKPLFQYALEGTLDTISLPTHTETIYRINILEQSELSASELAERIRTILSIVPRSDEPSKVLGADFRQDTIRVEWDSLLTKSQTAQFTVLRLRVTCASGTYMRTLASRIAEQLGTKAFALSIHRTKIGRPLRVGRFLLWRKTYC